MEQRQKRRLWPRRTGRRRDGADVRHGAELQGRVLPAADAHPTARVSILLEHRASLGLDARRNGRPRLERLLGLDPRRLRPRERDAERTAQRPKPL